jgi:hypothetical protein
MVNENPLLPLQDAHFSLLILLALSLPLPLFFLGTEWTLCAYAIIQRSAYPWTPLFLRALEVVQVSCH